MRKYGLALMMAAALALPAAANAAGPFSFLCNLLPGLCYDDTELRNMIAALQSNDTTQDTNISNLQTAVNEINSEIGDILAAIGPCEAHEDDPVWVACSGTCVNTSNDFNNCGGCGNACGPMDASCTDGECVLIVCPTIQCKINTLQADGSCLVTGNLGTGAACNDGLDCTTNDQCNGAGVCTGTTFPCPVGENCVEGSGSPPTCQAAG